MLDALDEAKAQEQKQKRKAQRARGAIPARITWGDWWDLISEDRDRESDSDRTDAQIVRAYIRPQWGAVPLNEIVPSGDDRFGAQEWVRKLEAGTAPVEIVRPGWKPRKLSASYVQRIWSVFSWSINAAIPEILSASPIAKVKLPQRNRRVKKFVSADEAEQLVAKGGLRQDYADAVAFGLETGLRPGELTGLHAHRIDWNAAVLTVAETYVFRSKKIRGWPKDGDVREVPLTPKAVEILRRRVDGRELRQPCGVPHFRGEACDNALVFLTEPTPGASSGGRPLHRDVLALAMKGAAQRAGTEPKSGYALRRGFATRLADGGLDAFALADVMGHADITMVQEYVQASAGRRGRVLAALGSTPEQAAPEPQQSAAGHSPAGTVAEFVLDRVREAELATLHLIQGSARGTQAAAEQRRTELAEIRTSVERLTRRGITDNYFLRVLAGAYADDPDFRQEWAVS
ncbi:tyrosine-type recombinase/integrase [Lentzea chajnantorensis]